MKKSSLMKKGNNRVNKKIGDKFYDSIADGADRITGCLSLAFSRWSGTSLQ